MSERTAHDARSEHLVPRTRSVSIIDTKQKPKVIVTSMVSSPMPDLSSPSPSISSTDIRPGFGYGVDRSEIYVFNEPGLPVDSTAPWESRSIASSVPVSVEQRTYACLFHTLDCHKSFDSANEWRAHIASHFGPHPTPSTARCPMCANTEFVDGSGEPVSSPISSPLGEDAVLPASSAWDRMLDHVAQDHYSTGQTVVGSRPDFELMRYLYGMRMITDAQFKAMQLPPAPSSPAYHRSQDGVRASIGSADEPYCAPYSKRREERMRQQKGVV